MKLAEIERDRELQRVLIACYEDVLVNANATCCQVVQIEEMRRKNQAAVSQGGNLANNRERYLRETYHWLT